jgi:uncharacterized membrane protein
VLRRPDQEWQRVAKPNPVRYIRGMTPPSADPPPQNTPRHPTDWPSHPQIETRQPRNLFLLAAHQIVLRVGWIFKTESVIMPAFLDQLAGAGWIRGCLPVLSRLGQGIPPLFAANYLRARRLKKRALAALAALMGIPFLVLSLAWVLSGGVGGAWMPGLFLTLYFAFFVLYGLYLVSFGTVQGKLIRPARRGYLIVLSTFWGAIPATLVAFWLMPGWLESSPRRWDYMFGFAGICFLLSGGIALMSSEPSDDGTPPRPHRSGALSDTIRVLRDDANLRRLVCVAVLFATGLIVFPHYQAFAREELVQAEVGREELGLSGVQLVVWVVAQNAAVALFSLVVGPLADRRGYRLVLRLLIFGSAAAPAFAVSLIRLPNHLGEDLFWLVFVALGIMPLVHRTLLNYALEICTPDAHARYQSVVTLGVVLPFLLSPAVGWLIDAIGFQPVFTATIVLILLSGLMTFRLDEPRDWARDQGPHGGGPGPGN